MLLTMYSLLTDTLADLYLLTVLKSPVKTNCDIWRNKYPLSMCWM